MNKTKIIESAILAGFKEYTPSKAALEDYDQAWQLKLDDDCFINLNFWDHEKHARNIHGINSFELVYHHHNEDYALQLKVYCWKDFGKSFRKIMNFAVAQS